MYTLERPNNLSDGAWKIIQTVYKNYEENDSKDFDDFKQFTFPQEELSQYCKELHEKRFIFWEHSNTVQQYIYMLDGILPYVKHSKC